jgi:DNA-binding FadR family transcriptional regulator
VRSGKTSDALATVLRDRILAGEFLEGSPLPSERELVDQTGLGRGSVREAFRVLEVEGLVRTTLGRNGGTFTTTPSEAGLARLISIFVRGRNVPARALIEARMAIESGLAFHAALNRTDEDVADLESACSALSDAADGEHFAQRNLEWHYCVARASHNELLVAFLSSISSAITRESLDHAKAFEAGPITDIRNAVLRAHTGITVAIVSGDAAAAKRRMERHLGAYGDSVSAHAGSGLTSP